MCRFAKIILLILPIGAWAETVEVRSGEHVDFSRLVMQFTAPDQWSVLRFDEGYIFDINTQNIDYNLNSVFDLIPRDRISKIEPTATGQLKIYTNPNFHADAFEIRSGRIVIDIKDGLPPPNSIFEQASNPPVQSENETPKRLKENTPNLVHAFANSEFSNSQLSDFDNLSNLPLVTKEPSFFITNADPLSDTATNLSEKERGLVHQLGRAASQGLLEVSPLATNALTSPSQISDIPFILHQSLTEAEHLSIRNSISPSRAQQSYRNNITYNGKTCIPNEVLDISMWGAPIEEGLLLPQLRAALVGEFDRPQNTDIERLAQYYLFLTFGAEAADVLSEFNVESDKSDFLYTLANIMEVGHSSTVSGLGAQTECGGSVGFWALMAKEKLSKTTVYYRHEITSYFSSLPLHLRRYLGPILAEKLLAIGDQATAKTIHDAIDRVDGDHGDAFELLNAEIILAQGAVAPALESFDAIVDANSTVTPAAMIRAIETREANNLPDTEKNAEYAEILTVEYKGTPEGELLENAAILARINSERSDIALQKLLSQSISDTTKPLLKKALDHTLQSANDIDFAQSAAFIVSEDALDVISDSYKSDIANRLLRIGFTGLAEEFTTANTSNSAQQKTNLAKIELSKGEFANAMKHLEGLESSEVATMRASILMQSNLPSQAAKEFTAIGDTDSFDTATLLEGNWPTLAKTEDLALSKLGTLLASPPNNTTNENLADLDALLKQSQLTRDIFAEILQ